jgi:hypothetical protein
MKKLLLLFLTVLLVSSCDWFFPHGYRYDTGTFPSHPVNLEDINSEFDDYNLSAPSFGEWFPLCFSSNRNSKGQNFDIIYKFIVIDFSRTSGELKVYNETNQRYDRVVEAGILKNALPLVNTNSDEMGPYLIRDYFSASVGNNYPILYEKYTLLYASDFEGSLDIWYTRNDESGEFSNPKKLSWLNTEFNEAYPSFNNDSTELYFCSDSEGDYDIFIANLEGAGLEGALSDSADFRITKNTVLSSGYEDKCPFINENLLVFASNRPGGFGGYDLYYSVNSDRGWSKPENFGSAINTEFDEYRPMVRTAPEFTSDFMMFSSNRPGGKGGFDLYYVGIARE